MRGRVQLGGEEEEWEEEKGEGGRRRWGVSWLVVVTARKGGRIRGTPRMEFVRLPTMAVRVPTRITTTMNGESLALAVVCAVGWADVPASRN